ATDVLKGHFQEGIVCIPTRREIVCRILINPAIRREYLPGKCRHKLIHSVVNTSAPGIEIAEDFEYVSPAVWRSATVGGGGDNGEIISHVVIRGPRAEGIVFSAWIRKHVGKLRRGHHAAQHHGDKEQRCTEHRN